MASRLSLAVPHQAPCITRVVWFGYLVAAAGTAAGYTSFRASLVKLPLRNGRNILGVTLI
jgi:hypothetical protein